MTDIETMKAMLKKANISYEEENSGPQNTLLTIEAGYAGFVSELKFGPDGALISIEAYE